MQKNCTNLMLSPYIAVQFGRLAHILQSESDLKYIK